MTIERTSRLLAILDNDKSVQSALQDLMEAEGMCALCFSSAEQFLHSGARHGDIPLAVSAMKQGASDFYTKPVDGTSLLGSVERALQQNLANRREATEHASMVARYQSLTSRERQVLPMLASGLLNKQVAFELGITECTVQLHRGHIMRKMEADSFAALVRMADKVCLHIPDRQESRQQAALPGFRPRLNVRRGCTA